MNASGCRDQGTEKGGIARPPLASVSAVAAVRKPRCRRPLNGFHLKSSSARTKKAGSSSSGGVGLSSAPPLGVAGSLQLRRSISAIRTAMAAPLCFLGAAADHSSFAASIVAIDHQRKCANGFFFDNAMLQLLVLLRKSAEKSSAPAHCVLTRSNASSLPGSAAMHGA